MKHTFEKLFQLSKLLCIAVVLSFCGCDQSRVVITSPPTDISINPGESVNFEGQIFGDMGSIKWCIEGISDPESIREDLCYENRSSFNYQFLIPGEYKAYFYGSDDEYDRVDITVRWPDFTAKIKQFDGISLNYNEGTINFEGIAEGDSGDYQYFWDFEGGSPSSSTELNPKNIYFGDEELHRVTFTVTDTNGLENSDIIYISGDGTMTKRPLECNTCIRHGDISKLACKKYNNYDGTHSYYVDFFIYACSESVAAMVYIEDIDGNTYYVGPSDGFSHMVARNSSLDYKMPTPRTSSLLYPKAHLYLPDETLTCDCEYADDAEDDDGDSNDSLYDDIPQDILESLIGTIQSTDSASSSSITVHKYTGEDGSIVLHKETTSDATVFTFIAYKNGEVFGITMISDGNNEMTFYYPVSDSTILLDSASTILESEKARVVVTKSGDDWQADIPKTLISSWSAADVTSTMDNIVFEPEIIEDDPLIMWQFEDIENFCGSKTNVRDFSFVFTPLHNQYTGNNYTFEDSYTATYDFGDGTIIDNIIFNDHGWQAFKAEISHEYTSTGKFNLIVTVKNSNGEIMEKSESEIIVEIDDDDDCISRDGDNSGVEGDMPCEEGRTKWCDDNCPDDYNPAQEDADNNGIGDACDTGSSSTTTTGTLTIVDSVDIPISQPHGFVFDGTYFWIADNYNDRIYKLDATGKELDSFATLGVSPTGLTSDGTSLWHTDASKDTIYKITFTGVLLEFFPSPGDCPNGLAFDGNYIWNVDLCTDKLYKLSLDGTIVDSFDTPGKESAGLTFDGNSLWLIDYETVSEKKIFQISTSGQLINTYSSPIPTYGHLPWGITYHSGYLWISDMLENKIHKVQIN